MSKETDYSITGEATTGTRTKGGDIHEPPGDDFYETEDDCPYCSYGHLWTDGEQKVCDRCYATRQPIDHSLTRRRNTTLEWHRSRYDEENISHTERSGAPVMGPTEHNTYRHSGRAICYGGYARAYADDWSDVIEPDGLDE